MEPLAVGIRLRCLLVLVVALFVRLGADSPVGAATVPETVRAATVLDWCNDSEVCGPGVDCSTTCYSGGPEDPGFETTCGDYGGEPVHGVFGNCLGTCGDGYCNPYNDEDYSSCSSDCGWCGDGICQIAFEAGGSGYCASDCGQNSPSGAGCDPQTSNGCDVDEFCNAAEYCMEVSQCNQNLGSCESGGDCCGGEKCFIDCDAYGWMCDEELEIETGVCIQEFPSGPEPARDW